MITAGSIRSELALVESAMRGASPKPRESKPAPRPLAEGKGGGAQDAVEKGAQALTKAAMDATKAEDPNTGTALQMISGALLRLSQGDVRGAADALESAVSWVQKMPSSQAAAAAPAAPADDGEPTDEEVMECFGLREDRRVVRAAQKLVEGKKKVPRAVAEARSAGEFMALAASVSKAARDYYLAATSAKSEMDNWESAGFADFTASQKKIYDAIMKCIGSGEKATKDADQFVGLVRKSVNESRGPVTERDASVDPSALVYQVGPNCRKMGEYLKNAAEKFGASGDDNVDDLVYILGLTLGDVADTNFGHAAQGFKTLGEVCADLKKQWGRRWGESREGGAAAVTEAKIGASMKTLTEAVDSSRRVYQDLLAMKNAFSMHDDLDTTQVAFLKALPKPMEHATRLWEGMQDLKELARGMGWTESRQRTGALVAEAAVPEITGKMQSAIMSSGTRPDLSRAFRRYSNHRASAENTNAYSSIKAVVAKEKMSPEDEATLVAKVVYGKPDWEKLYGLYFTNPQKFALKAH